MAYPPKMRISRLTLALVVALSSFVLGAPAQAHMVKASATGTVTGTLVIGLTTIIDVKIRIHNKAKRKRDIGCDFLVRRSDTDAEVGAGFAGAVVRGGRSKSARTTVNWNSDSTSQFYVEILHCHSY